MAVVRSKRLYLSIHNFTKEAVVDLSGLNRGVYAVALLENGVRIGTKTISL